MTVTISPENEQFLRHVIATGRFYNSDEAINEAVGLLRQELESDRQSSTDSLTAEEWCAKFEAWASGHRHLPCEADDSRESIYAGRGE